MLLLTSCSRTLTEKNFSLIDNNISQVKNQTAKIKQITKELRKDVEKDCNSKKVEKQLNKLNIELSNIDNNISNLHIQTNIAKDTLTLEIKVCKKSNRRLTFLLFSVIFFVLYNKIRSIYSFVYRFFKNTVNKLFS